MILTESSVELARVERTLMPYFFSNAAPTGRTSWEMIWVVYQITSPSFLAASIIAGSAAQADPAAAMTQAATIERSTRHGHLMAFLPKPRLGRRLLLGCPAATRPQDLLSRNPRQFEAAIVPIGQGLDRRHHLRREQPDVLLRQIAGQRAELQHADELLEPHEVVALGDAPADRVGAAANHDPTLDQM